MLAHAEGTVVASTIAFACVLPLPPLGTPPAKAAENAAPKPSAGPL
jgi:hypothetical protein